MVHKSHPEARIHPDLPAVRRSTGHSDVAALLTARHPREPSLQALSLQALSLQALSLQALSLQACNAPHPKALQPQAVATIPAGLV